MPYKNLTEMRGDARTRLRSVLVPTPDEAKIDSLIEDVEATGQMDTGGYTHASIEAAVSRVAQQQWERVRDPKSMSSEQYMLAVSLGQVPGVNVVTITGRNRDIDEQDTPEDLWEAGGLYPFQTSAVSCEILSDSVNDNPAGTGARQVLVGGLLEDGTEHTEVLSLNGTTPVPVTSPGFRWNTLVVLDTGTSGSNEGTVTLRTVGTQATQKCIFPTEGLDHTFVYTVPKAKRIVFGNFFMSSHRAPTQGPGGDAGQALISFLRRSGGSESWLRIATWSASEQFPSVVLWPNPHPNPLNALTDVRFTVERTTQDDADVSVGLNVYLIDDGVLIG